MGKSWGIFLNDGNNAYFRTREIRQILKRMVLTKMSQVGLNYVFQLFWVIFGKNLLKTSLFSQKVTILERSSELFWKLTFPNNFSYGKILRNIFIWWKQLLLNQWNLLKLLLLIKKVSISERNSELLWKLVFLTIFVMGKSWRLILFDEKKSLCLKQ